MLVAFRLNGWRCADGEVVESSEAVMVGLLRSTESGACDHIGLFVVVEVMDK